MNLGELILTLRPLLADAQANSAAIVELLEQHRSLAEFEVARFYASRAFAPVLEQQAKSLDPRQRALAARGVGLLLAGAPAARLLRRLAKDPDSITQAAARSAMSHIGVTDVALPDTRCDAPFVRSDGLTGGWNFTGWSFGLFRGWVKRARQRSQLTRTGTNKVAKPSLPELRTPEDLAKFLGVLEPWMLRWYSRPGEGPGSGYVAFEIPKATGGTRRIHAPRVELKTIQRRILDDILAHIPVHEACHGFVEGRSVVSNAAPHQRARVVLKVDLLDFFPTIHFRRVAGLFGYYGYPPAVARLLASVCTHQSILEDGTVVWPGVLPQGAPTSPALANAVCRRLDARLSALATKVGARYTRYADDLTFSFAADPEVELGRFFWWVDQICQAEGFTENAKKRRVLKPHMAQRVTGVVVNGGLTVPRQDRREFRALLHRCKKQGLASVAEALGRPALAAEMAGFAAWVSMVMPDLGGELLAEVRALGASK